MEGMLKSMQEQGEGYADTSDKKKAELSEG